MFQRLATPQRVPPGLLTEAADTAEVGGSSLGADNEEEVLQLESCLPGGGGEKWNLCADLDLPHLSSPPRPSSGLTLNLGRSLSLLDILKGVLLPWSVVLLHLSRGESTLVLTPPFSLSQESDTFLLLLFPSEFRNDGDILCRNPLRLLLLSGGGGPSSSSPSTLRREESPAEAEAVAAAVSLPK